MREASFERDESPEWAGLVDPCIDMRHLKAFSGDFGRKIKRVIL